MKVQGDGMSFTVGQQVRHIPTGQTGVVRAVQDTPDHGPAVIVMWASGGFTSFIDTDRPGFNRLSELKEAK